MTDMRSYSKEFITEFIDVYKELPCLWKVKSKEYSNRDKRNQGYNKLVIKLKEVETEADKETVIKKINSLRTAYRRELKKVAKSKRSGVGTDDIYIPKLWYFNLLTFTDDQEVQRDGKSTLDGISNQETTISTVDLIQSENNNDNNLDETVFGTSSTTKSVENNSGTHVNTKRKKKPPICTETVLDMAFKGLSEKEDEFTDYGRNVANKLRKMSNMQRIIAEKMMNEVLFYGKIGKLNFNYTTEFANWINRLESHNRFENAYLSPSTPSTSNHTPVPLSNSEIWVFNSDIEDNTSI